MRYNISLNFALIFLTSTFQDHLAFGWKVETAYRTTPLLSFVTGLEGGGDRDASDGRRERHAPSLGKGCKALQQKVEAAGP